MVQTTNPMSIVNAMPASSRISHIVSSFFLGRYAKFGITAALCLALVAPASSQPTMGVFEPLSFAQLEGWAEDPVDQAWPAWMRGCTVLPKRGEPFASLCAQAQLVPADDARAIRNFFETQFVPHRLLDPQAPGGGRDNTVTGYYEPELRGSRSRSTRFNTPLYRPPPDLVTVDLNSPYPELRKYRLRGRLIQTPQGETVVPYSTRGELETQGLLKGLEIVYVEDPVEAFFLQVQGSGRVILEDGSVVRLAYANQNGHPYRSIGRWLVEQGELKPSEASMQGIKKWLAANPHRESELLHQNPSMIFFRERPAGVAPSGRAGGGGDGDDGHDGPIGSLGVPISAGRSIALDPRYVALGLPVFLSTQLPTGPTRRLVMAQDTGSAIVGPHRADFFFGSGPQAGEVAGRMKARGEMVVLLPR